MANLVKYGSYSHEAADRETKQLGKTDYLKLEVGRNRVRVLPPKVGRDSPFVIIQQHMIEVPGEQYPHRFGCPGRDVCPACAKSAALAKTGNPKDRDASYQWSAKPRVFALVIARKDPERGPIVWEFGKKIHEQLKALRKNEDAGGDFTDPYNGFDVIIERTGTGKNDTKYQVMAARQSSALHEDEEQMVEWLENAPDIERMAKVSSPEELRVAMGDEDGADEEDAVPPARRLPPAQRASAPSRGKTAPAPTPRKPSRSADDDVIDAEVTEE